MTATSVRDAEAMKVTWEQASARRADRQFLGSPAPAGTPVAEVVGAMLGAHAQVLSAAELSVGLRAEGVTRADVRAALWEDRTLVKTFGPRGTVHLLPTAELPFWTAALTAIPSGGSPFAPDVRLTDGQVAEIVAAIATALDGATPTLDELSEEAVARTGPWAGDLVMPAFQDPGRRRLTVEPLGRLTARQERELGERAARVGEVLEAEAELAIGKVTVGPHA